MQVLTVGQYLRPTRDHLPVVRYWHPDEFAELEREAYALGFESVAAGPLVRSSYHAEQTLAQAGAGRRAGMTRALLAAASPLLAAGRRFRRRLPGAHARSRRRGLGTYIYVVGGFERARAGRPPRSSATTSARGAGGACAPMPIAAQPLRPPWPTAATLYVHGGYAGERR